MGVNRRTTPQSTAAERGAKMLVLSRKLTEEIVVRCHRPTTVVIAVVGLRGDKVRLGVEAPGDCTINRGEVQRRIDGGRSSLSGDAVAAGDDPVRDGQAGHVERLRLMDDAREIVARAFMRFDLWMTADDAVNHIRDHGKQLIAMADRIEQFTRSTAT